MSCGYSKFVEGICGPSIDNPANKQRLQIEKCSKETKGHLNSYNVKDAIPEAALLLARAGKSDILLVVWYNTALNEPN